ncbi:MAG: DUF2834 domain-containing protein [Synechococcaceae cyanobacterium]|nr:DUF2834 domain-containing protein [Synechococcaceae cyanobacterium]
MAPDSPSASPSSAPAPRLSWVAGLYLLLAIAGAIAPWLANIAFMREHPGSFDFGLFVQLANANPAAQSLSRDLAIGATAFTIWIVRESRRLQMRGLWLVLLCSFGVAFACGAPLFLYLRERRLLELERNGQVAA